ncbi:papilin [Elysia marginata]|uniref:Papilin n=1 Tax=Elysia marginata TaxID=1093978 RepID=A0AAV4IFY7_9GAST|nr:papilin [Elysia marginata]
MEWLPQGSCDDQGEFKSVTQAAYILNPTRTTQVCLDRSGMPDPSCRAATCHLLSTNGLMDVCENGGRCVGDVRHRLCDCSRTGYHGFRCHLPGRTRNETACTLGRDIAMYALSVLHDENQSELLRMQMNKVISLHGDENAGVFVPSCDSSGRFEFRGCVHPRARGEMPTCYCATADGQMVGDDVSLMTPPEGCEGDRPHGNGTSGMDNRPQGNRPQRATGNTEREPMNQAQGNRPSMPNGMSGLSGNAVIRCSCDVGYSGKYCDMNKESRSLCEFMASAFDSLNILTIEMTGQVSIAQMAAIMNVTSPYTFPHKNNEYFVRPDCTAEGGFASSAVCFYNVRTREKDDCFCWAANGPDFQREVAPEEDPFIVCSSDMHCANKIRDECPDLKCVGGYRTNLSGCPVCECKHPCEDLHCEQGERCYINSSKCHMMSMGLLSMMGSSMSKEDYKTKGCAMCVPVHKPGVCPDHNMATYGSIIGGGLGYAMSHGGSDGVDDNSSGNKDDDNDSAMKMEKERMCRTACRDDADCPGKKKCCGLCGSRCVDPVETFTCSEESAKMSAYIEFLKEVEKAIVQSQSMAEPLDRDTLTTLNRINSVPHIWRPSCESDGHLFKPLQCEYSLQEVSGRGKPTPYRCFCVDRLGMRVPGTEGVDHNDPSACTTKPGVCPYLTYGQGESDNNMHTCTSDVDCLGKNKCCSNGVGMVCVPSSKEPKMATTDRLMTGLCKINSTQCKGLCSGDWGTDGYSCRCTLRGRYGPFCEQTISAEGPRFDTVCRKKNVARYVFEHQFAQHETKPQGMVLLYEDYISQMYEMVEDYDWTEEELTMVKYECTRDGGFQPMQCVRDVNTWQDIACYCVDENGSELIGTRKHVKEGRPRCGGDGERMCPAGYPLHGSDGDMLRCGENVDGCPRGYSCTRGAYGRQHCCLTKEGARNVCQLPVDVGMECGPDMRGIAPGTRYYFNGKQCVAFQYKGCGGNRNHFRSMESCEERCKEKVHEGSCPARPFQVLVNSRDGANCKNHCSEDKDCDDSYKCCQSTCGRHCFPAIVDPLQSLWEQLWDISARHIKIMNCLLFVHKALACLKVEVLHKQINC